MEKELLYTVEDLADILKTSKQRVYKLIGSGLLPAMKLGGYKVRRSAVLIFLKEAEGKDLSDLNNIKNLELKEIKGEEIKE